jgi:hypothetical protein
LYAEGRKDAIATAVMARFISAEQLERRDYHA